MSSLRKEWDDVNSKEFSMDEDAKSCPTCKREFESDKIEQLTSDAKSHFESHKKDKLNEINSRGKSLKKEKERLEKDIDVLNDRLDNGKKMLSKSSSELDKLRDEFKASKGKKMSESEASEKVNNDFKGLIEDSEKAINDLNADLVKLKDDSVNESLEHSKKELYSKLDSAKEVLADEKTINKCENRIRELLDDESKLSNNISKFEKQLFVIEEFTKAKISKLEDSINEMFTNVSFKLFETQVNGAEVETCKALINGVPFSDANTASNINAGIDIINTLNKYYEITAPIFIDNRESVVDIIDCESQIINLFVSKEDKELRVDSEPVKPKNATKAKEKEFKETLF